MGRKFNQTTKNIQSVREMFQNGQLVIDDSYQRRSVWLLKDKIALIETILLELVIPELFFWTSDIDPNSGKSITHIVDGQQRIRAIDDFVAGNFSLQTTFLLNENSKERWGGKYFIDLSKEDKKAFWDYKLNIIEIEREVTTPLIADMFKRLNLTNYNLNDQERRNSNQGLFANCAKKLLQEKFWDDYKLFNGTEVKRMKDVEFCAILLLLYRHGIIDQPNQTPINQAYADYAEHYPDAERDQNAVLCAIAEIEKLVNKTTIRFLRKRGQLYSVFSFVFPLLDKKQTLNEDMAGKFSKFVSLYDNFTSDFQLPLHSSEDEMELFELLKSYKLASSEGINKLANRVIRRKVLSTFLFDLTDSQMNAQEGLLEKFRLHKEKKRKNKVT